MARSKQKRRAEGYRHPEASSLLRPEVGVQAQFRKKKPPATYHYDSSLSPALDWDGKNASREQAEATIAALQDRIAQLSAVLAPPVEGSVSATQLATAWELLADARNDLESLKTLSEPFLNWSGKAERLSFDVPTLPLFVHERLSTAAILGNAEGTHQGSTGKYVRLVRRERPPDP